MRISTRVGRRPAKRHEHTAHRIARRRLEGGASGLYEIDTETGTVARIHQWAAFHLGLSIDSSQRYVVQQVSRLETTGEINVFDRQAGSSIAITRLNDATFAESPPALWERF